jgi:hypothetical protein
MEKTIINSLNTIQTPSDDIWDQWLAGLIDGDGSFVISKKGQITCEITVALADERLLQEVKQKVCGVLKLRSGSQSIRLRIFKKDDLINIIKRVNGHIRLASRYEQFTSVCAKFEIPCLPPLKLHSSSGYMAGFFDADGSVTLTVNRCRTKSSIMPGNHGKYMRMSQGCVYSQLSLHIVCKEQQVLEDIQTALGFGKVLEEKINLNNKRPNILHRWCFRNHEDVTRWLAYIEKTPLRSVKKRRCSLLNSYFQLKANKFHLSPARSLGSISWDIFCREWFNVG